MTDMATVKKELHKALLALLVVEKAKRLLATEEPVLWDRAQSIYEDILLLEENLW
jgi:hypothetical protein